MINSTKKKIVFPIIVIWILTLTVCLTRFSNKIHVWGELPDNGLEFTDGRERNTQQGDQYGNMTQGPGLNLPAGTYRLKWIIDCDGTNEIKIKSHNNVGISPNVFYVNPDKESEEVQFTLEQAAEKLEIETVFRNGTFIHVYDYRLYSPPYNDIRFGLILAAALFSIFWIAYSKGKRPDAALILIAAAVVYASVPSFRDNFSLTLDTSFHVSRLWNLADGLKNGQIPVRCGGYSYNGFGAVTSVFYPDLFLYPFAIMLLLGISTNFVFQSMFISLNIIAALTMFRCARRLYHDRWTTILASILYVLSIYRITDVYVRGALGEAIAMSFLPVFVSGFWEVFFGNKKKWPLLTFGMCSCLLSHVLTAFMCCLGLAALFLVCLPRLIRERRIGTIVLAGCFVVLICIWQFVPMLDFLKAGVSPGGMGASLADRALSPAQLFLWGEGDMAVDPMDSTLSGYPVEPGMVLILGVFISFYVISSGKKWKDEEAKKTVILAVLGIIGAWATTTLFPWNYVRVITKGITDYLQFPWRFMVFPSVFFSLAGAYGYCRMGKNPEKTVIFVLLMAVMITLPTINRQTRFNDVVRYGEITQPGLYYPEYNLPGTRVDATREREPSADGGIQVVSFIKNGNTISCEIEAERDGTVIFPVFGFIGYDVRINNKKADTFLAGNNQLAVKVPAGICSVSVRYSGKPVWHVADGVSLCSLIGLIVITFKNKAALRISANNLQKGLECL